MNKIIAIHGNGFTTYFLTERRGPLSSTITELPAACLPPAPDGCGKLRFHFSKLFRHGRSCPVQFLRINGSKPFVGCVQDSAKFLVHRLPRTAEVLASNANRYEGFEALASAIAGRLHAHQPGILPVLHVADENAVLDQHSAIAGSALVVNRERAAAL